MECKFALFNAVDASEPGINRYIMECKLGCSQNDHGGIVELIDTLWNVNVREYLKRQHLEAELIDTLWNVNYRLRVYKCLETSELIDTLWNVNNLYPLNLWQNGARINRYIMECK